LHGPALEGEGIVQNEVDALLDAPKISGRGAPVSSGPTSQGDIDKLFA